MKKKRKNQPKIVFILEIFPSLSQTFILNQITGLIDLGYDIDILASYRPNDEFVQNDVLKYGLLEKTNFFSSNSKGIYRIFKSLYSLFTNIIKLPKVIPKLFNLIREEKLKTSLESLVLVSFIGNKYDIIHCQFGNVGGIHGPTLKKAKVRGKLITSFYGYDITKKKFDKTFYRDLFYYGDLFLPICNYFKENLVKLGCNPEKIKIHPLGIDTSRFKISEREKTNPQKVSILSVGRLVEKKGHEYTIQAFSKLNKKIDNIELSIVGEGRNNKKIKNLIKDLNLEKKIHLLGALKREKVIKLYKNSQIFILCSVTSKKGSMEGTPTVLLEAQVMKLPVVSTLHSGIPEIVVDKKSGFLVPEKAVELISEKLEILLKNPKKRVEMGNFGRRFVKENFDMKLLNRKLLKHYISILRI